jgi:YYY domain-containing protein
MGLRDALRAWRPVVAPRASALPAASAWERAFGPLLLLAWVLPYFAVVGSSFAKFARYMLPILPALSVLLALGLAALARKHAAWARGLAWLVGLFALGHGLGYALTYTRQHPWLEASVWTFTHVPPTVAAEGGRPTRVLNEDWGDDLPVDVERIPSLRYEQLKGRPGQVNIVEWDSANKLQRLSQSLSDADIIMLADPRAYGTYLRLPLRFPLTHAYYDLLFNDPGRLGFELAHEASNPIKVFGLFPLPDSRIPKVPRWLWADESFTLYDRPHTFIFRRVAPRTPEEQRRVLLERIKELGGSEEFLLGRSPDELQRRALSRVSGGAAGDSVGIPAAGDINPNFGRSRGALRPLLQPVLTWWLLVTVLGWLALPLAVRVFSAWPAGGYPLSKALGVLLFGYLAYQLAEWRWLPFTQAGLWLLLVLLAVGASLLLHRRRAEARAWFQAHRREIFASEAVFAAAFLFFVVVRLYNPNIHDIVGQGYFGGGEPLGMTYLSSVTRCVSFPAYDPWLALHNSSYYYFGYVLVAALTKLSGFPPSITYNLSLALFFSLTLLSAYGLLRAFAARRRLALAGAAMVALAGSLWSVAYIAIQVHRGFSPFSALFSHGFIWDPTRFPELVNGHIFEFPYFSYLYGDLHPHNMVVAFSLLLLALLAVPFLAREGGWRSAGATPAAAGLWLGLTALLLDVQYALNTWSWPVFVALSLGALLVGPWAGKGLRPGQAFVAAFSGLGAWLAALLLGRLLMHGFREWFLQSGTARLGRVLPQEWQMSAYIPLAFFLPGLAALAILGGARLRAYAAAQAKGLGWERLARRDWLDRSLSVLERLFERRLLFALAATAGLFLVGGLLAWAAFKFQTQGVLALALGLGLAAFGLFLLRAWEDGTESFLWLLGAFTCFLVAGSERWFVADRMNTIFKFWFNGWILMGVVFGIGLARAWGIPVSAAAALPRRFGRGRRAPRLNLLRLLPWFGAVGLALLLFGAAFIDAKRLSLGGRFGVSFGVLALLLLGLFGGSAFAGASAWWRAAQRGVWGGLLALGLLYPLGATLARIHEASQFKHPHLDGLLFMQERVARGGYDAKDYDADDYALIRWLNEHADVTETLLEAPGIEMYKGFSRYSIYTGLPTLLGWDYQVGQQLGERTGGILTQRRRDAALIYTGSPEQARELLKKYRVRWIVVGGIERQLYGGPGLEKFDSLAELVASSGPSKLYRFAWDKP